MLKINYSVYLNKNAYYYKLTKLYKFVRRDLNDRNRSNIVFPNRNVQLIVKMKVSSFFCKEILSLHTV